MEGDEVTFIDQAPAKIIQVLPEPADQNLGALKNFIRTYNESISLAIENKCAFMLTVHPFHIDTKSDLQKKYGLQLVTLEELEEKIEHFLQGLYNYFKFKSPIYGISSPDLAHAMSDPFFQSVLIPWETNINKTSPSQDVKERVRSFIHNRYVDILTTVDQVSFFKIQQKIHDVENGIVENKNPFAHGYIRYYLNYHLFLLWGAIDHLAWLINDVFLFGYNPEKSKDRGTVGLRDTDSKKEFLEKIKGINSELYEFIVSKEIQEWLYFFGQLRHKNSHREMFSASPLLLTTDESQISDEEIDKIIYKDRPVIEEEESIRRVMPEELFKQLEENQRNIDRTNYRISKMKKGIDHFAMVEKNGQNYMFDPVGRIPTDLKNLRNLIEKVAVAYGKK